MCDAVVVSGGCVGIGGGGGGGELFETGLPVKSGDAVEEDGVERSSMGGGWVGEVGWEK